MKSSIGYFLVWLLLVTSALSSCAPGADGDDDSADDDEVIDDDAMADDDTDPDDDADNDLDDDSSLDDDQTDDDLDDDDLDDDTLINDDTLCFLDLDGDGYGQTDVSESFFGDCPLRWAYRSDDCNDNDPLTRPEAPELPDDGIVQNCGGADLLLSDDTGVFVAKTGNDDNPGTMAEPKLTVVAGVAAAAAAGKAVFVAAGEYEEDVVTSVSLYGGYEPAGWTRDIGANVTTIVAVGEIGVEMQSIPGGLALQGFTIYGASRAGDSYGVYDDSKGDSLVDNIIHGGSGTGESFGVYAGHDMTVLVNNIIDVGAGVEASYGVSGDVPLTLVDNEIAGGAGLYSFGVECSLYDVRLMNNTIEGGSGSEGSVAVDISKAILIGNSIHGGSGNGSRGVNIDMLGAILEGNEIDGGTGTTSMAVKNSGNTTMMNNTINGGAGVSSALGVFNAGAVLVAVNNFFDGGSGSDQGTCAVQNSSGTATLVNNIILGGAGTEFSAGFIVDQGTTVLVNNIIDGGWGSDSRAMSIQSIGSVTLVNNDLWGAQQDWLVAADTWEINDLSSTNACGWPSCSTAADNISDDPLLVDLAGGDFHLSDASPCRDTGINPVPVYIEAGYVETDFEGDVRPYGNGWDIGMDEWVP